MGERDPEVKQLVEAVNKAGIRLECPACTHKVSGAADHVIVLGASGLPESYRALGLACERCGFVSLFMASVLDQYMDPRSE